MGLRDFDRGEAQDLATRLIDLYGFVVLGSNKKFEVGHRVSEGEFEGARVVGPTTEGEARIQARWVERESFPIPVAFTEYEFYYKLVAE